MLLALDSAQTIDALNRTLKGAALVPTQVDV